MSPSRRRHVVFVVMDTARADAFEPYGAPAGATPASRDLAARGAAVPYAVAPSSWTLPSHAAFLLGDHFGPLGLTRAHQETPQAAQPVLAAHADRYLPNVLHRAGYRTVAASTNLWIQEHSGFGVGFDEFHSLWHHRPAIDHGSTARDAVHWAGRGLRSRGDDGLERVRAITDRFLSDLANTATPMFLFLNLVECHSPYLPPRPYDDLPAVGRLLAGIDAMRFQNMGQVFLANLGGRLPPPSSMRRMRHLYDRSVRYMDDWLADFVERLDALGLLDDTLIVVTSDHGENFGEGGRFGHAFSLDDNLIHVPLIMSGFEQVPADPVLSLVRLPQLIADEIGLRDHPWQGDHDALLATSSVDGIVGDADPRTIEAMRKYDLPAAAAELMSSSASCATDARWKVVRRAGREQVFDLHADTDEVHPVTTWRDDEGAAIRRLQQALDALASSDDADLDRTSDPAPALDDAENERLREQMRMLGYL